MPGPYRELATRLVHAGEPEPRIDGAVALPIFQTAMYTYQGGAAYDDIRYIRLNNSPNHRVLGAKLASVCGAEAGLVASSGMAAISSALLAQLRAGDHLLAFACLYGGTHTFMTRDLTRFGIEVDFVDPRRPDTWAARLRPETRLFYAESISNPLLEVGELEAVVAFCREHGLVSMVDNTFATPVLCRPAEFGFDLVLHSGTKYMAGHSDLVCGAAVGRADLIEALRHQMNHLGGCLDPHACFMLYRGLKTLELRVRRQCENAAALAVFLSEQPAVRAVSYPGLPSHPDHARAARLLEGAFGAMLAFELDGGAAAARHVLGQLRIALPAVSLGGVETLASIPAEASHAGLDPEERRRIGIADGLLRVSLGIEDARELCEDFAAALAGLP